MFKRLLVPALAILLVIPGVSMAKDMSGLWGLGFYSYSAPVGARVWIAPNIGLDAGIGLDIYDIAGEDGQESATDFYFEVGVPFVLVPTERVNFYLRPGVQVALLDSLGNPFVKNRIAIMLAPGVEYFLTDQLSIEASHGLAYEIESAREEGVDDQTFFYTFGENFTFLGFHFYFR